MGCCFASDKDTSSSSKNPKRIQVNPGVPNVDIKKKDLQPTQVNIKSPKPNPDVFEESKANQYDNIRPEERKKLSIDCKIKGNEFFKAKKFVLAINEYTQAIKLYPQEAAYYSNRALCYKSLSNWSQMCIDADMSITLDVDNYKGYQLKACSLIELGKIELGSEKLVEGINLLIRSIEIQSMNARDKEIRNELIMKLKKAKKILWLKNKETIQQKKTHTSKFIEKLLDKNNANETDKQEYKSLFDKWSSETMGCYQVEIPEFLQCKITFELIKKPYMTNAGVTYEEETITAHFKKNGQFDPCTRQQCNGPLVKNKNLERAIATFEEKNPWSYDFDGESDYRKITI